jgi:hypothetical protein
VDKPPFTQTFVGAVLAAVLAGLIGWFVTGRQPVRVELSPASVAAVPEQRQRDANRDFTGSANHASVATAIQNLNPRERTDSPCIEAVIEDPDRYTNIRSGPSTNYEVIARVVDGEVFCVTAQNGRWWTIRTANRVAGYIYYDRVRIIALR